MKTAKSERVVLLIIQVKLQNRDMINKLTCTSSIALGLYAIFNDFHGLLGVS